MANDPSELASVFANRFNVTLSELVTRIVFGTLKQDGDNEWQVSVTMTTADAEQLAAVIDDLLRKAADAKGSRSLRRGD